LVVPSVGVFARALALIGYLWGALPPLGRRA
jgi:hypothetical protein